jgi:hypothetical protein
MSNNKKLYYAKCEVDGRCIDMLLSETEIARASKRLLADENKKFIPETCNTCWPIEQPPKCSFWNRIIGNCKCD